MNYLDFFKKHVYISTSDINKDRERLKKFHHEEGGILLEQTGGKALATGIKADNLDPITLIGVNDEEDSKDITISTTTSTTDTDDYAWTKPKARQYLQMLGGVQQTVTQDPETGVYSQSEYSYTGNSKDPKGFRNNNWLNIRISNNDWQGKIANNTDGQFEQFETPELGIRAATKNIRTYGKRGLQTVKDIISTWAPASENNTSSYIQHVASRMGVDPNQTLDLNDTDTMVKLISAMTISENGRAGDESIIRRGVEMA